jgi:hypothetical protein
MTPAEIAVALETAAKALRHMTGPQSLGEGRDRARLLNALHDVQDLSSSVNESVVDYFRGEAESGED